MIFTLFQRYIARTVTMATLSVMGIVAAVSFLLLLLGELKAIGDGGYNIVQALAYVLLRLPNELYQFLPALTLLGSVMTIGLLSLHRELIAMQASGFSLRRIALHILTTALLLIIIASILGEWFAPDLSYRAEMNKENAQHGSQVAITASGVWFHVENNFIHVEQIIGSQLLEGVTRYQFDSHQHLMAAYFAKKLILINREWWMVDAVKTVFFNNGAKSQAFERIKWELPWNNNLLTMGLVEPSQMSLRKLIKLINYLHQNGLQVSQYQYVLWQRIFQPVAAWVMVFLALAFSLGQFRYLALGWKAAIGIAVGFSFFILNALLGQLCIVFQLPAMLAAGLPLILFTGVGLLFLVKGPA